MQVLGCLRSYCVFILGFALFASANLSKDEMETNAIALCTKLNDGAIINSKFDLEVANNFLLFAVYTCNSDYGQPFGCRGLTKPNKVGKDDELEEFTGPTDELFKKVKFGPEFTACPFLALCKTWQTKVGFTLETRFSALTDKVVKILFDDFKTKNWITGQDKLDQIRSFFGTLALPDQGSNELTFCAMILDGVLDTPKADLKTKIGKKFDEVTGLKEEWFVRIRGNLQKSFDYDDKEKVELIDDYNTYKLMKQSNRKGVGGFFKNLASKMGLADKFSDYVKTKQTESRSACIQNIKDKLVSIAEKATPSGTFKCPAATGCGDFKLSDDCTINRRFDGKALSKCI